MMKYRLLQWKELGGIAVVCAVVIGVILELVLAIHRGVIDIPVRAVKTSGLHISLHDHPFWFWLTASYYVVIGTLLIALFAAVLWGYRIATRNIAKKYPMTNRWTGRF